MTARRQVRCAIYTRKSSEDGLEQAFNSLDAQHEACAAYVASQKAEGWRCLPTRYDDGGVSGGTLVRPALQRLLEDIAAGGIDMVVVYKIDRLTRSLTDFARLVDQLDAAQCSFVSVTQSFNTSTSMGRLTLNMLLSFAQFEREVTAERIRDKIAASKKKGLWMGGTVPLGYDPSHDPQTRSLVINEAEARTVRRLFELYAEHGCLRRVTGIASAEDLRSKRRVRANGEVTGNGPLSRGQIYYLLRNPVYLGRIRHKDKVWPGVHAPIIDTEVWNTVQTKLQAAANRPRTRSGAGGSPDPAWITGKLRDETGDRLTPTHTTRHGRRLRYYISNRLISGGSDPNGWRLPAPQLEAAVKRIVASHLRQAAVTHSVLVDPDASRAQQVAAAMDSLLAKMTSAKPETCAGLIVSGVVTRGEIRIELNLHALAHDLGLAIEELSPALSTLTAPFHLRRRGIEAKIIAGKPVPDPDPKLCAMLIRAHGWAKALKAGTPLTAIAKREGLPGSFIRTRAQIAFLSPKIQEAILEGTQPPELTLKRLVRQSLPLNWVDQERLLGI